MRRWLTILMLLVLPGQFAWSAAAAYCQHEQVPAKAHIGHHVHEHEAPGDSGSQASDESGDHLASKAGNFVGDNDCGYCNLSFAKPMISVALHFDISAAFILDSTSDQAFSSRGPDLLERPNWRSA